MGKTKRRHRIRCLAVLGVVAAAGALGLTTTGRVAAAQAADAGPVGVRIISGPAGTVRADVTIRQRQMRVDGQLARAEAPLVALRLDRQLAQGRWRTTFTYQSTGNAVVKHGSGLLSIANPFVISRVEYDEDTAEARAYDRTGRRVPLPTDQDRQRFGVTPAERGPGWDPRLFGGAAPPAGGPGPAILQASGFYVESSQRDRRRADIQQKFGRTVGRLRGFDRFVVREGSETRELLVVPETSLPVEVNTARGGVLASRLQLQYILAGSLGYVRQSVHSERAAGPSSPGELVVTDIGLGNIELATRSGR